MREKIQFVMIRFSVQSLLLIVLACISVAIEIEVFHTKHNSFEFIESSIVYAIIQSMLIVFPKNKYARYVFPFLLSLGCFVLAQGYWWEMDDAVNMFMAEARPLLPLLIIGFENINSSMIYHVFFTILSSFGTFAYLVTMDFISTKLSILISFHIIGHHINCRCEMADKDFWVERVHYKMINDNEVGIIGVDYPEYAMDNCTNLCANIGMPENDKFGILPKELVIPLKVSFDGIDYPVVSIEENAFNLCCNLEHITLSNNIRIIKNYAFRDCWELNDVVMSNSLECIGIRAFSGCSNLTTIIVPIGSKERFRKMVNKELWNKICENVVQ